MLAEPLFAASSQVNTGPAAGERMLRSVRAAAGLPLVVIGGITPQRTALLYAFRAAEPQVAARAFFELGGAGPPS